VKKHRFGKVVAFGVLALLCTVAPAQTTGREGEDDGPALTVYSTADPAGFDPQRFIAQQRQGYDPLFAWQVPGFGVVKETRRMRLDEGPNELRFTDVAEFIDPTTVGFTDLTAPDGTTVLEQSFQFDLVGPEKLLDRYIDRDVGVVLAHGDRTETITGVLLSASQGRLVLETPEGLRILGGMGEQIQLGELPGGLLTRPTLLWKVQADRGGEHRIRTTYQTGGITWRADYNLVLDEAETQAELGAWVSLLNLSGAGFANARLKLIAGDVQRVEAREHLPAYGRVSAMAKMDADAFVEKPFFEYHLYTLARRTDVLANTTQQITLFPTARGVGVEKLLVYSGLPEAGWWNVFAQPQQDRDLGSASNPEVDVYLRFRNEKRNRLGMPLPAGKVRVYKQDEADGTLEFIGEDVIAHTPRDEKVLIQVGRAFDVVGERTQVDFSVDTGRRTMTESFRIQVRNHKDRAQKVLIRENLYRWSDWEIVQASDRHETIDSRTIHFEVEVPANGEKTVTYTVRYTW
jgi:hypothetical protein